MTMIATAQAVFNTAELLEAIFLELPPLDVIIYQRVSKTWRKAIEKSPAVQRSLFLAPEDAKGLELEANGRTLKKIRKSGPEYVRFGFPHHTRVSREVSDGYTSPSITLPPSITINPMLKPLFDFLNGRWRGGDNVSSSWTGLRASWQNMFLTQPPTVASAGGRVIVQGRELASVIRTQEYSQQAILGFRTFPFEYTGELVFPPKRLPTEKVETLPEKNPNKLIPSKREYVWDTEKQQWSRNGELL